ncbi:hypothetical protein [Saccharothrix luteola]|uniref:hypothetical protein n=1 Tax=Saccharothrix luteola TaxID=2893018 RepID=UPI001E54B2DF|nr:hypothetical protein [Saccharothrix luteola]MCC8246678.1 hypothetical protein [Saccharothrix luteola]
MADSIGYRQGTLWLTPDELTGLAGELMGIFRARAANGPAPGRRPYLLSPVFFPIGTVPDAEHGSPQDE